MISAALLSNPKGTLLPKLKAPMMKDLNGSCISPDADALASAAAPTDSFRRHSSACSRLRFRWLQFQKRHVSRCREGGAEGVYEEEEKGFYEEEDPPR